MDLGIIYINQSLVKHFVWKGNVVEHCPSFIYAVAIAKTHKFSSLTMDKGSYFETGCIGGCADGSEMTDLPRKKLLKKQQDENRLCLLKGLPPMHIGEKSLDQQRIDTRIAVFKQRADECGLILTKNNCQTTILKRHPEYKDCILKITMDMFPVFMVFDDVATLMGVDLKLTKGIDFVWNPDKVKSDKDHIQMQYYHEMIHDIDFELNPHLRTVVTPEIVNLIERGNYICAYWVWDYKDDSPVIDRFIPYQWSTNPNDPLYSRRTEMYESVRKTYNFVRHYNEHGWKTNPSFERCHRCPKTAKECPDKICVQVI